MLFHCAILCLLRNSGVGSGGQSGANRGGGGEAVPCDCERPSVQDQASGPGAHQQLLQAAGTDAKERNELVHAHQKEGDGENWQDGGHGRGAAVAAMPGASGEVQAHHITLDDFQAQRDRDGRERERDLRCEGVSPLGMLQHSAYASSPQGPGTARHTKNQHSSIIALNMSFMLCADEEDIPGRDLRVLPQDGTSWDGRRSRVVRSCASADCGPDTVRDPREGVQRSTAPQTRKEDSIETAACTPSYACGGYSHRGDCGGGAAVQAQLAPVPREVERIPSLLGGVAPAWQGVCGRSSGKLGACSQDVRDAGISEVEGSDLNNGCVMLRSCDKCGGCISKLEHAAYAGIMCDGASHTGDRSLQGRPYFPCYTCAMDWCETCAALLQPSVGADVIKVKLHYDKSDVEEPTLKLGWAHAVSRRGAVAGSGPRERRDHGHLVSRVKLHEVQQRCRELEGEVTALHAQLKVHNVNTREVAAAPQAHEVSGAARRSLFAQRFGTHSFDSPPPLMAPLRDTSKRAQHDERRAYQEKYCSTQLVKMKMEVERAQDELASARKRVAEVTFVEQEKQSKLRKRLRGQRVEHLDEVSDLVSNFTSSHLQEMEQQKARLLEKHEAEVRGLQNALEEKGREHAAELQRVREELQLNRAHQRELSRQAREEVLSESSSKIERLRAEWEHKWEADRQRWEKETHAAVEVQLMELAFVERTCRAQKAELQREVMRLQSQLTSKDKLIATLKKEKDDLVTQIEGERTGRPGRPAAGLQSEYKRVRTKLQALCDRLQLRTAQLPSQLAGDLGINVGASDLDRHSNSLFYYNVQFVVAALRDRHPAVIAAALCRNNQVDALLGTRELQPMVKHKVRNSLDVLQQHWSARHAVILMSEVHTSRPEFDALRHLLSFVYDRGRDTYERIPVWQNPLDPKDKLFAPTLAARKPRERERAEIYSRCDVQSSEDGLFSVVADLEQALSQYVAHYWSAIDPAVQDGHTPLMVILTGDATGGWRGDAVTHGELGIGSWAAGKAQSKLTLLPIFLMEGDDSAENLRSRIAKVAASYNAMKKRGSLAININGKPIRLQLKLLVAADFQFFKAVLNMSKYTSAIWCTCLLDAMYKSPENPITTWREASRL